MQLVDLQTELTCLDACLRGILLKCLGSNRLLKIARDVEYWNGEIICK